MSLEKQRQKNFYWPQTFPHATATQWINRNKFIQCLTSRVNQRCLVAMTMWVALCRLHKSTEREKGICRKAME